MYERAGTELKYLVYMTQNVLAHELGHAVANMHGEDLYLSTETDDEALYWDRVWRIDHGITNVRKRH